jgi:hypothetical protein
MSGGGGPGANPKVDIKTKSVTHNSANHTVKRDSDVAVTVPLDNSKPFTIGIMVKNNQAATASLVITNPVGMGVVKESLNGTEATKLKTAFKPLSGHRWVAFTGTTLPQPAPPPPATNLQTELTLDSSQIDQHGFQLVPIVVHYTADDWTVQHYLVGTSIIPGPEQLAVGMRAQRGTGHYAPAARSKPQSRPKQRRAKKNKKR